MRLDGQEMTAISSGERVGRRQQVGGRVESVAAGERRVNHALSFSGPMTDRDERGECVAHGTRIGLARRDRTSQNQSGYTTAKFAHAAGPYQHEAQVFAQPIEVFGGKKSLAARESRQIAQVNARAFRDLHEWLAAIDHGLTQGFSYACILSFLRHGGVPSRLGRLMP